MRHLPIEKETEETKLKKMVEKLSSFVLTDHSWNPNSTTITIDGRKFQVKR